MAANSKTPISILPPKMQTERMENKANVTHQKHQKIYTLEKQLGRAKEKMNISKMCMDGSQGTAFLENDIAPEKTKSASSEETRDDHARDNHHGIFCNNMQSICSDISKDKKSFAQSAR